MLPQEETATMHLVKLASTGILRLYSCFWSVVHTSIKIYSNYRKLRRWPQL